MNSLPDIFFVENDFDSIVSGLETVWKACGGGTIRPASPERLMIQFFATILCQQGYLIDRAAKQNVPRYAEGENLDSLADIFYKIKRLEATAASTVIRFITSIPVPAWQLIPKGTRVKTSNGVIFETEEDVGIPKGESQAEVSAICQTVGARGNGHSAGEISELVDEFPYYERCENIWETAGGSDRETDAALYKRMRESMEGYTTAGSAGAYEYWARSASSLISSAKAVSPTPYSVTIYILLSDGTAPGEEILNRVLEVCGADNVKPMTDVLEVKAPEALEYEIDLTWYLSEQHSLPTATIQRQVAEAIERYKAWQSAEMGRHLNPTKLIGLLYQAGVSRVEIRSPAHTELLCNEVGCQVAKCVREQIEWGGFECE